jgi:hypothetical protein
MLTIVAKMAAYGAAPMLAMALRKSVRTSEIYFKKDNLALLDRKDYGIRKVKTRIAIFVGACTVGEYMKVHNLGDIRKKAVIITDSHYLRNAAKYDRIFRENEFTVFAMGGILPISGGVPFYQAIDLPSGISLGGKKMAVCHSPGDKINDDKKGTNAIIEACNSVGIDLKIITGLSWADCVREKAKYNIFIDHIILPNQKRFGYTSYCGDLGKSGIEAMKMGSLVITSGNIADTVPYFPPPPVVLATPWTLEDTLREYINTPRLLSKKIAEQRIWANKHLDPDFIAKNILDNL